MPNLIRKTGEFIAKRSFWISFESCNFIFIYQVLFPGDSEGPLRLSSQAASRQAASRSPVLFSALRTYSKSHAGFNKPVIPFQLK